ncbi:MAG: ABC transporter permease subunit [Nocardioidaceae bacterium]
MNLLRSELVRFAARRAVVLLLLLGFVLALLAVGATLWNNRPITDAERAESTALAQQAVEACQENPRRYVGSNDPARCDQLSQNLYVGRYVAPFDQLAADLPQAIMGILGFTALLAGTTYVGAEFASGALSNTLLFWPNRLQVWLAKVVAVTVWTTLFAAVTIGLCLLAVALVAETRSGGDPSQAQLLRMAGRGSRVLVVVVASAVLGAALTTALRATIATTGIVIGYLLVGETLLRAIAATTVEPWLLSIRVLAFVRPVVRLEDYGDGFAAEPVVQVVPFWSSVVYLAVLSLVALTACAMVFHRRDVP